MPNPTPTIFVPYHAIDDLHRIGTRAAQPVASVVTPGTLYCVTDESNKLERSNGLIWETYAAAGGTLPPNIAYTNVANLFTQPQYITVPDVYSVIYIQDNTASAPLWYIGSNTGNFAIADNAIGQILYIDKISRTVGIPHGKLQFPNVQIPSTDPYTLDDYKEGTWTPFLTGGGGAAVYNSQVGEYIKIGRLVHASGYIVTASKGSLTEGNILIQGLPFPATTLNNMYETSAMFQFGGFTSNWTQVWGLTVPNSVYLIMRGQRGQAGGVPSGGTLNSSPLMVSDISDATSFVFSVNYIAAS